MAKTYIVHSADEAEKAANQLARRGHPATWSDDTGQVTLTIDHATVDSEEILIAHAPSARPVHEG